MDPSVSNCFTKNDSKDKFANLLCFIIVTIYPTLLIQCKNLPRTTDNTLLMNQLLINVHMLMLFMVFLDDFINQIYFPTYTQKCVTKVIVP